MKSVIYVAIALVFALILTSCSKQVSTSPSEQPATFAQTTQQQAGALRQATETEGTPAGTVMTPEYVATVGRLHLGLAAGEQRESRLSS
jgi:PBP1b-binding outer membrane lipoprotein LpoB